MANETGAEEQQSNDLPMLTAQQCCQWFWASMAFAALFLLRGFIALRTHENLFVLTFAIAGLLSLIGAVDLWQKAQAINRGVVIYGRSKVKVAQWRAALSSLALAVFSLCAIWITWVAVDVAMTRHLRHEFLWIIRGAIVFIWLLWCFPVALWWRYGWSRRRVPRETGTDRAPDAAPVWPPPPQRPSDTLP